MRTMRGFILVASIFAACLPGRVAFAAATAPCTAVDSMPLIDIIPLSNGVATYCVSDYGWSDAWFVGSVPVRYDPRLDVLSGDDAPNLHFGIRGGAPSAVASGFGWISPVIDGGTLTASHLTGSPWTVTTPVHLTVGTTTAQSLVHHPLGLDLQITTSLDLLGQEIMQSFVLTNVSDATTFEDIVFADYFNFHPNGSTAGNFRKGTATYTPLGGIRITGPDDGTLIANGSMRGERVDDLHGTNATFPTVPDIVIDMVQTVDYPDPLLPDAAFTAGPGDVAGGLAWRLDPLAPGASQEFTIFKLAEPLGGGVVPEPAGAALLTAGLLALCWQRRVCRAA